MIDRPESYTDDALMLRYLALKHMKADSIQAFGDPPLDNAISKAAKRVDGALYLVRREIFKRMAEGRVTI